MRHQFTKTPIPEGQDRIVETCVHGCGIKAIRYKSGNIAYLNPITGKTISSSSIPPGCLGRISPVKERFKINSTGVGIVLSGNGSTITEKSIKLVPQGLTQQEALLKDSLTIIQIMYNDLVERRIYSRGRTIAANLLISQGYKEIVSHIESKLT